MKTAVNECPDCKSKETHLMIKPEIKHEFTEIHIPAYCADCGHSWYIVYTPDNIIDRR